MTDSSPASWWLYVLKCADGSLYTGITTDVDRRLHEHNHTRRGARYTRPRRPVTLYAKWPCDDRSDASRKEAAFKSLTRKQKLDHLASHTLPELPAS